MNELLQKANKSMLEGDRDAVQRHLNHQPSNGDVLWLRAQSALTDDERLPLLREIEAKGFPVYSTLAKEILLRERKTEQDLKEPPDYQFWKQPTWETRLEKVRSYKNWIYGAVMLVVLLVFVLIISFIFRNKNIQTTISIQATQTAEALNQLVLAEYPAGTLRIVTIEDPTTQLVIRDQSSFETPPPATPALGGHFVAVRFTFICKQTECQEAPHARVELLLKDRSNGSESTAAYDAALKLPQQPAPEFISIDKSTTVWLVFTVPDNKKPVGVQVFFNDQDPAIRIYYHP